jgi:hypothetical protein
MTTSLSTAPVPGGRAQTGAICSHCADAGAGRAARTTKETTVGDGATGAGGGAQAPEERRGWVGRRVLDAEGRRVGTVGVIFRDRDTGRLWAEVRCSGLRKRTALAPLDGAQESADAIRLAHPRSVIRSAPEADLEVRVDELDEHALHRHYGLEYRCRPDSRRPWEGPTGSPDGGRPAT